MDLLFLIVCKNSVPVSSGESQAMVTEALLEEVIFERRIRRRSIGYCGLHISVGHLPGAGFHCGRYHAFPGSASLAGHIHRKAFRHSGKQRRQPQTAVGFAAQS